MGAYSQILQDKDFLAANPKDQQAYLSHVDPDYAKASPADQTAYLSYLTQHGAAANVPKPTPVGNALQPETKPGPNAGFMERLNYGLRTNEDQTYTPEKIGQAAGMAMGGGGIEAVAKGVPAAARAVSGLPLVGKAVSKIASLDPDLVGIASPRAGNVIRTAQKAGKVLTKLSELGKVGQSAEETDAVASAAKPNLQSTRPELPEQNSISSQPPITQASIQEQLNSALGGKALQPNVPLREQLPAMKSGPPGVSPTGLPPGHTAVESSAVSSFKYSAETQELEVHPKGGTTTYKYGDVSPEQAAEFQSGSVGKAWNKLRQGGSPLIAKRISGKWVPLKPTSSLGALNSDLTNILQQSVAQVKARQ